MYLNNTPLTPHHLTKIDLLVTLDQLIQQLLNNKQCHHYQESPSFLDMGDTSSLFITQLKQFIQCYANIDHVLIKQCFKDTAIPPYYQLLLNCDKNSCFYEHVIHIWGNAIGFGKTLGRGDDRRIDIDYINLDRQTIQLFVRLMNELQQQQQSAWFKHIQRRYQRQATDNLNSYGRYIESLFEKYSRLLIIRVDLGYRKYTSVDYNQFCCDIDRFISLINYHPVFDNEVGYIWKLEYGKIKEFHAHLLFLFDGSKRQKDYYIAQQIGELWQNEITLDRGLYFNCNTQEQMKTYPINCLGMVHRNETAKIKHLAYHVIAYFTKIDPYLKLLNDKHRKITDRGQRP